MARTDISQGYARRVMGVPYPAGNGGHGTFDEYDQFDKVCRISLVLYSLLICADTSCSPTTHTFHPHVYQAKHYILL